MQVCTSGKEVACKFVLYLSEVKEAKRTKWEWNVGNESERG